MRAVIDDIRARRCQHLSVSGQMLGQGRELSQLIESLTSNGDTIKSFNLSFYPVSRALMSHDGAYVREMHVEALLQAVLEHPKSSLHEFHLKLADLGPSGGEALGQMFKSFSLKLSQPRSLVLNLNGNLFQAHGAACIIRSLSSPNVSVVMSISGNQIQGNFDVADAVAKNTSIIHLDMSFNVVPLVILSHVIRSNSTLQRLVMREVKLHLSLPPEDEVSNPSDFGECLAANKTLQHLDLSRNTLTQSTTLALARGLKQNSTLTCLELSDVLMEKSISLCSVMDALCTNVALKYIMLSHWSTSEDVVDPWSPVTSSLWKMLQSNQSLTSLSLEDCGLTCSHVKGLATVLKFNGTLAFLNLSHNLLTDVSELCESLKYNKGLSHFGLCFNNVSSSSLAKLSDSLTVNQTLKHLDLSHISSLSSADIKRLSESLKVNQTVQVLRLMGNGNIGADGARHLADVIMWNKTLRELNLQSCHIWPDGAFAIAKALTYNITLRIFHAADESSYKFEEQFLKLAHSNGAVVSLDLDKASERFCLRNQTNHLRTREIVCRFIAIRRTRPHSKLQVLPKDIVQILAVHLLRTRTFILAEKEKSA